jgi:hypothetical protein
VGRRKGLVVLLLAVRACAGADREEREKGGAARVAVAMEGANRMQNE